MERTNQRDGTGDLLAEERPATVIRIDDYVTELGARVTQLRARTAEVAPLAQGLLLEALEALQNGQEELAVVDEEMRRQHAELVRERVETEAALRHFRELFDLAPDAYVVTDAEGVVRDANVAAARIFNIRASFLIGKPLVGFVARQDGRHFRAMLLALTAEPFARRFALRVRPRQGRPVFAADVSASAVRAAGGRGATIRWIVREPVAPTAREARQSRLVTDLLTLLGDARDGDEEAIEWHDLVERAASGRRPPVTSRGPSLDLCDDGERCRVVVQADRLVLALSLLIDDALDGEIESGRPGVVRITVGREGAWATVRITAASPPPVDAVGQPVARRIVTAHGGTLTTSFDAARAFEAKVALPLSGAVAAVSRHPVVSLESSHADLRSVRVLVVEDDDDSRELLAAVLAGAGAEVEEASNAADAVSLISAWRPDVLVSDIGLPGRDGYDLLREVRALGEDNGGAVPAIALTGFSELEDSRRAIAAGFQVHVGKPTDAALLTHAVANVAGMKIEGPR
jgi:PAS domain S-box-containing protein